jgi:hypothetical protein
MVVTTDSLIERHDFLNSFLSIHYTTPFSILVATGYAATWGCTGSRRNDEATEEGDALWSITLASIGSGSL